MIFAHRAVRSGQFFWTPLADLGGNMGGMFSFYLWGSPFFWLTIPFPESWLPYLMPYLMALKYGTAAALSCAWIRTQVRSDRAAVLGAMLYAFSGFQACNIVFQHFHDATAFFPLYLLSFDRFVEGRTEGPDRYGFTLMTALMSVINYYFFFGQVLFLLLYYWIRYGYRSVRSDGIRCAAVRIIKILAAGAYGLLLSAFFLVQSVGGILGNARVSKVLSGYDLLVYPDSVTPLAILKSLFMVPDLIARSTMFASEHTQNGSLAFYLPCFAMAGVFAYWRLRRKSWKKTLLVVLAVMAFVPVLCAAFSAMNENFYARWFYMPVLLCACMTAEAVEEEDGSALSFGALLSLAFTALFLLFCFLPVKEGGEWSFTAICKNRRLLNTEIVWTLFGAAVLGLIVFIRRRKRSAVIGTACLLLSALCCVTSTFAVLKNGSSLISYTGFEKWKRQMLTEKPVLQKEQGENSFFRVETDGTSTNYEMVWGIPTMHCFESTVHPSIFRWYRGIGMIRTVESTLPLERIGARALMSVRYYIENTLVKPSKSYTSQGGIQGYQLLNEENGYNVHETVNYIPMGFSFDSYMTEENYKKLDNGTVSDRVLVKDIILSDEMAAKYGSLLREDTDTDPGVMPYSQFSRFCADRAASSCDAFAFDNNGFHALAQMEKAGLLLFSIPYDRGFSVQIDGEKAEAERADFGLTAIFVPAGTHTIQVTYLPVGFIPGAALSALALLVLVLNLLRRRRGRHTCL